MARPAGADNGVETIDEARLLEAIGLHPRVARIASTAQTARADAVATGLWDNPVLSYEREHTFPEVDSLSTNYVRFSLPLQISGVRRARVDAARSAIAAVVEEGDRQRFVLTVNALRTFRTAGFARALVELLLAERAALVQAVDVVRKRTSAGSTAGYDLQRIELELAAYDDRIAAAQTQLALARTELGVLVGATAVDAADAGTIPELPPAATDLAGSALADRSDVRALESRIASADSLARAGERAWIPDLAVTAGLMTQSIDVDTTAVGYTAQLSLSVPLFDHGQADRARAAAQRTAAEAERTLLEREIPAEILGRRQIFVDTIARAETIATTQVAKLDQLVRSAETAYREGSSTIVELLDAYTTARDTRVRDLELRRDARLAELDLWLVLGRLP